MENIPQQPTTAAENHPAGIKTMPTIRTYGGDVSAAVRTGGATQVSMAIAEAKRRDSQREIGEGEPSKSKNLVMAVLSILLIVLGIGVSVFFYLKQSKKNAAVETKKVSNQMLVIDSEKNFDVSGVDREKLLSTLQSERATSDAELGTVEAVTLTLGQGSEKRTMSTEEFLTELSPKIPDVLLRSLDQHFTFGIHLYKKNEPFLLLTVDSYQSSFAGMLSWEANIPYDLGNLFLTEPPSAQDFTPEGKYNGGIWSDAIVENTNSRVIRDKTTGNIAMLYSFVDKNTLLMTTNEDTFREVVNRIRAQRLIKIR